MTSATLNAAAGATKTGPRNTKTISNQRQRQHTTTASNVRSVSALMYASQQADVDKVRKIIRDQPHLLNSRDRTGKTPLHYVSTNNNICAAQAADLLVMAAPELVDKHDEDGFTPLHLAVIAGNLPLVTFLLANKADVNAVDNEKHTVVHWATVCGETAALSAVLAAGAPASTPDVHGGYPLHYAAQMCGGEKDSNLGLQVLQHLLTHTDIQVAVEDGDGRQPLLWAASAGSSKAVLALIRAGASIEAPDKDGLTALHCAASRGHTDVIDSLLTLCGASPDVIDSNGCTALHYAVTLGHADATALLLAHGANPNRQDRKGRSPAHCGCAKGQFETVKMIGNNGGNLWLRNARGDLPLHEASASGRRDLVRWLLDMRPSQVNARNNDGRCPLHLAALNDNVDMCKILLDSGAQINPILRTSKNHFMTPLDCALQRGFRSTAKYLQLNGGVPASRLADVRNGARLGSTMQIRDDVMFWGDTSSDSERENGHPDKKSSQKVQRKKIMQKLEKRKVSSGSDLDARTSEVNRRKMAQSQKFRRGKASAGVSDSANSSIDFGSRRKSSQKSTTAAAGKNRLEYTNEIIINGKTEINIHQSRDISVGNSARKSVVVEKSEQIVEEVKNNNLQAEEKTHKETKRPKSAKPDKTAISATKSKESSAKILKNKTEVKINTPNSANFKPSPKLEDEKTENVDVINKNHLDTVELLADQQSLVSNTSEDAESHEKLIVEASIHEPPQQHVEKVVITSQKDVKNQVNEIVKEVKEMGVQWEDNVVETTDGNKNVMGEEINQVDELVKEKLLEKFINEEIREVKKEKSVENIKFEEATKTEDTTLQDQSKESDKIEDIKKEEKVEITTRIQVTTKVDKSKIIEASKADDKDKIDEDEKNTEQTTNISIDNKKEQAEIDQKIAETLLEAALQNQLKLEQPKVEEPSEEEPPQKVKSKKKHKKEKSKSAYEIIYKTLPDGESTDTAKQVLESDNKSSSSSEISDTDSTSTSQTIKEHKSFRILNEDEAKEIESSHPKQKKRAFLKKQRSKSDESKSKLTKDQQRKSKIPLSTQSKLSKSERHLNLPERTTKSNLETSSRVPSLPNINSAAQKKDERRCESNMSAPQLYSGASGSEEAEEEEEEAGERTTSAGRKKKLRKRSKSRPARSAGGSDYESSNVIDSGFEPSPRSSRIPKWKNMSDRGVNMTSVTQSIQTNIRRYHLERKIFQHLLELKRLQIRSGQHNEAMLVKRAIDMYHQSCAATVGAGRYVPEDFTFKSFEKFLYLSLRKLQRNGADYLKGLPESPSNPLLCTQSTHRCMHATHAYTGIPCAAYLPKMDHHTIPKIGFNSSASATHCKPGTAGFLPTINPKKAVTLELCHGNDKQLISLPADQLDQNKKYYVTFTVKGANNDEDNDSTTNEQAPAGHTHSKSD